MHKQHISHLKIDSNTDKWIFQSNEEHQKALGI